MATVKVLFDLPEGALHVQVTDEGLICDLYDHGSGNLLGTRAEMATDIAEDLLPQPAPIPAPSPLHLKRWVALKADKRFRFGYRLCFLGRAMGGKNWCRHRTVAIDAGQGWTNVPGSPDRAYQRRGPFWVGTRYNDPIRIPAT